MLQPLTPNTQLLSFTCLPFKSIILNSNDPRLQIFVLLFDFVLSSCSKSLIECTFVSVSFRAEVELLGCNLLVDVLGLLDIVGVISNLVIDFISH